jgi:thiamine-phosphate diphosphorylase / hydroxyethylthiazole kinase
VYGPPNVLRNNILTVEAITAAKKILPKDAIVGISASCVEDAVRAVEEGADYLGIGTMFATPT